LLLKKANGGKMLEIVKNMFRRKVRTVLTIFGITIGVLSLVVMGAMAEKIKLLVDGGTKYYSDKVIVSDKSGMMGFSSTPLSIDKAKEIEKIQGVKVAAGIVGMLLDENPSTVSMGPGSTINAQEFRGQELESFKVNMSKGRKLEEGDRGKVTVGADLVKKLNADVGNKIKVRGKEFEVVGISEKTLTAPDSAVAMTLPDAQEIFASTMPEIIRSQIDSTKLVTGFTVYIDKSANPDEIADKINKEVDGVKATGPKAFKDQIESATKMLNQILYGIAAISLIVGGLSVINTMTMSISERTKEIGIKKAVGAKTRNVMGEYLTEAGIIGLFGGLLGVGIGAFITTSLNSVLEKSGDKLFLLTPRLVIGSILFSVILGIIAGVFPAVHATRISIVKALREE
jgi:putative ABC transport system permease protein